MAQSIYITSAEGDTGKSTIALGLVELLARNVERVGVFRPVARGTGGDYVMELLLGHEGIVTDASKAFGVTYDDVHADSDAALSRIVRAYHEVERESDFVVIVGTDYTDVAGATELNFNARVAANLGAPVALVLRAEDRTPEDLGQMADLCLDEIADNHAEVVTVFVNKCRPDDIPAIKAAMDHLQIPVFTLPNEQLLSAPSVRAAVEAVNGHVQYGDPESLNREVMRVLVGAMNLEHLLERLVEGAAVVVPGDRSEVMLGLLNAQASNTFPSMSAIFLSGGFAPPGPIQRLLEGLNPRLPIVTTQLDTFEATQAMARTRGELNRESQRKVDTALALFERNVDVDIIKPTLSVKRPHAVTPLMFEYDILERARANRRHIVLPEGADDRILRAASTVLGRGIADLTILGNPNAITARANELGLDISAANLIDPQNNEWIEQFAEEYTRLRAHKGMTLEQARETVVQLSYFGTMMVHHGLADGMVSGAMHTTANTIKPAFEVIKTVPGTSVVSSVFLMCLADRVLVYGDCAVNPDPTAPQLADIAISSSDTAAQFNIDPRVAMLSYSTGESGYGADVDKVREATALVKERRPDLFVEGPIQYDAAVDASVAKTKMPESKVAGKATVFIFPDLNTGNNTYKAVQRSAGAVAIGPVLQGLNKPVNDLSRGALVVDIVNTIAITAIQAHGQQALAAGDAPAATQAPAAGQERA